jgi:hypothetical protein
MRTARGRERDQCRRLDDADDTQLRIGQYVERGSDRDTQQHREPDEVRGDHHRPLVPLLDEVAHRQRERGAGQRGDRGEQRDLERADVEREDRDEREGAGADGGSDGADGERGPQPPEVPTQRHPAIVGTGTDKISAG